MASRKVTNSGQISSTEMICGNGNNTLVYTSVYTHHQPIHFNLSQGYYTTRWPEDAEALTKEQILEVEMDGENEKEPVFAVFASPPAWSNERQKESRKLIRRARLSSYLSLSQLS